MGANLFSTLSLSFQAQPAKLFLGSFFSSLHSPSALLSRFPLHPGFLCPHFLSSRSITLSLSCLLISIFTFFPALLSPPCFLPPSRRLFLTSHPCLVHHLDRSMSTSPIPQLRCPPIISLEQVLIHDIHRPMNNSPKTEQGRRSAEEVGSAEKVWGDEQRDSR